jgi:hypothetical protein
VISATFACLLRWWISVSSPKHYRICTHLKLWKYDWSLLVGAFCEIAILEYCELFQIFL